MAYKLEAPPSNVTGTLGDWLRKLHAIVEAQPNISVVSFGPTATPNSSVTGLSGDLCVNIGSGATDGRLWMLGGNARSALTQRGWVSVSNASASYAPAAHHTTHENGGSDVISIASLAGTPTELANHAALTTPHSATAASTASRLVLRDAAGGFAASTITAALSGNASTASSLATTRTIWGQNFDGSSNVSGALSNVSAITMNGLLDNSGANGGQFKFPATQNASSDSNTLDDYEEGAWTPSVGGNATYATQTGRYIKLGKQVYAQFSLSIATLGTGSQTAVTGLPFTIGTAGSVSVGYFSGLATNVAFIGGIAGATSTGFTFYSSGAAGTALVVQSILTNGSDVRGYVMYEAST